MRQARLLAIVLVLVVAACGPATTHATPAKTRACLDEKGARIGGKLDFVASTATGGAFVAHLKDNFVTIVFGDTEDDAKQIQHAYERFAFENVKQGLPDVLRREGNVVMLWHEHPQDADLETVSGCLK